MVPKSVPEQKIIPWRIPRGAAGAEWPLSQAAKEAATEQLKEDSAGSGTGSSDPLVAGAQP